MNRFWDGVKIVAGVVIGLILIVAMLRGLGINLPAFLQ